jgi:glycosyltransferase involved in cell wall biosynthesis
MYLGLPMGRAHGWGICGKQVARHMACLGPTRLITEPITADSVGDPLDYRALCAILADPTLANRISSAITAGNTLVLDGPLLMAIVGISMAPLFRNLRGHPTLGYTFFEENHLTAQSIANARGLFDRVATGSTWCTQVLKDHGYDNAATVLQGVDPVLFHPAPAAREYFLDQFVIFSGGKFEFRKGQDLVIRAVAVMQQRHPDVMLVNAWYNIWPSTFQTMRASPLIRIGPSEQDFARDYVGSMTRLLADNGLDAARTMTMGPSNHLLMPRIYHNTDLGLFTNRCEGGTNLVLMEYMACGKPVIASYSSGHRDVLTDENSLPLRKLRPMNVSYGAGVAATWDDPDLEEVVERLEWAYQNRDKLGPISARAADDMGKMTWAKTAAEFRKLLVAG